ncbi:MAG TPA: IS1595 family transposase [Rhizomicrobium sp.]|jgi:transposase-like protein|nr:IS1595 family transposase [Rhizomicrobium sp.]
MAKTTKRIHQMTIKQWEAAFPTEEACAAYLVRYRWPVGVRCPRCGSDKVFEVGTMAFKWQCYSCAPDSGYRFSHIAGTIFENTNKPLRDWFRVIHMMLTSKKGISALQVMRVMGFGSYKTAHYMCQRIRAALAKEDFRKLMGIVEVDETYIGGNGKNQHGRHNHKRGISNKTGVIGAVERKGNVVARVLERVTGDAMKAFVRETVSTDVSLLATDEHRGYHGLDEYSHDSVMHSSHRYVVGAIHTNTIEGFWSLVKRSIVGSYHKVGRKYLPLYIAEAQFRYNNRLNRDIFAEAIRGC